MTLSIAQLGQPILRKTAQAVPDAEIRSGEFQKLVGDMLATVQEKNGAGLAGPQVFSSRRVFVAKVLPDLSGGQERGFEVFINPQITPRSEKIALAWEGCLSFPELLVLVPRLETVVIEYLTRDGERKTLNLENTAARIVQHEFDHLEGILTIDRAPSTRYIVKASEIETVMEEMEKRQ